MKKILGAVLFTICVATAAHAQGVGINGTGAAADTSAILDLSATNKGFLPPRMKQSQRLEIVQPATGLLVYQTDGAAGLWYNAGSSVTPNWKQVLDGSAVAPQPWSLNGSNVYYSPGFVGIGTATPNAPLSFPPVLSKKITLYPGASGDVGFGVAGNRLQIFADHSGADVAVGWDQAGTFNERFAFKPNGALAVNGNVGAAGQVLQSNGAAVGATWVNPTHAAYGNFRSVTTSSQVDRLAGAGTAAIPGATVSFTTTGNAMLVVSYTAVVIGMGCTNCSPSTAELYLFVDGGPAHADSHGLVQGEWRTSSGTIVVPAIAGTHTVSLSGSCGYGAIRFGAAGMYETRISIQIIPE